MLVLVSMLNEVPKYIPGPVASLWYQTVAWLILVLEDQLWPLLRDLTVSDARKCMHAPA